MKPLDEINEKFIKRERKMVPDLDKGENGKGTLKVDNVIYAYGY